MFPSYQLSMFTALVGDPINHDICRSISLLSYTPELIFPALLTLFGKYLVVTQQGIGLITKLIPCVAFRSSGCGFNGYSRLW